MINAIGMAVVGTYLLVAVGTAVKRGDSSLFGVIGRLIKAGVTKVDDSVQNYIEEKDEEMLEKVEQVKQIPSRKKVKPIEEETNKYEIFM